MDRIDALSRETGFSGVIAVGDWQAAYGEADRAHHVPNTTDTRFGIASGSKAMTALVVMSLIGEGLLRLDTPARELLGTDLPLIDDAVTIEHLLGHTSGIGDYIDEDTLESDADYVLKRPVHELTTTEAFLPELDGYPQEFPPGERFAYCNGAYVVLALLAERACGIGYHRLVTERVLQPAGMTRSDFLRSDDLPGDAAIGYLGDGRTNVLNLPVLATGDGGMHTTLADVATFWTALFAGRVVPRATVDLMTAPRSDAPEEEARYGLGFWLDPSGPGVRLAGADAGVAFFSHHDPTTGETWTVIGNDYSHAWPIVRAIRESLTA